MKSALRAGILGAGLCVSAALSPAPAGAQEAASVRASASEFFDAGAQAYEAGQYLVAAEAFQKAYERVPSPSLLFSAAQAYRRHYLTEPSPDSLQRAVSLYRAYLRADPKAKRREDAMQALEALAPLEAQKRSSLAPVGAGSPDAIAGLSGDGGAPQAPAAPQPEVQKGTRLLLSSGAKGAELSVDGGPFLPAPTVVKVQPGPRQVRVRAPGYFEEQVTVEAVPNELIPSHVPLKPKPARLSVIGTSGARVSIDGQKRATVPMKGPIAIDPGPHFIAVTRAGHEPVSQQVILERDSSIVLRADLSPTSQRIAAWGVLAAGASGVVVSGVLAGLALSYQSEAIELRDKLDATPLLPEERDRYNLAVAKRNGFGVAAGVTGGAAALTLAIGVGLVVFDEPEVLVPSDQDRQKPTSPAPRVDFDVGLLSLGARVRF